MEKRRATCGVITVVVLLLILFVILLVLRQCQEDEAAVTGDETEVTETEEEIDEVVDMLEAVFTTYDLGVDVAATDVYTRTGSDWYATTEEGILRSLDGGGTWAAENVDPGPLSTIGAYLGGSGLVGGGPNGAAFLGDGSMWWPCTYGGAGEIRDVFSWGPHVWLIGDGIFYSPDDGSSWGPQFDFNAVTGRAYNTLEVLDDYTGFAAGDGLISRTYDGGFTGTDTHFDGSVFRDLDVVDPMHVVAVGDGGLAKQSTDGGENWIDLDVGTTDDLLGVAYFDTNHGVMVSANGGIYSTFDQGETWDERSYVGDPGRFNSVSMTIFPSADSAALLPDLVVFGPGQGGIDSVRAPIDSIFEDGFESGDTSAWSTGE